jgi:adenylate kinase
VAGEDAVEGEAAPKAPEPAGPAVTFKHVGQRRPHSSLRALQTTENLILQKGNVPKDQLRTYVVWPGVLYGCGEGVLHPLFKAGWKGEQPVLPILNGGKTVLPMIHVRDLAAIVVRISEKKPEQKEFLAVDDGRCKQADIVKAIASSLQDGSVVDMNTSQYLAWMSENDASTEGHLLHLQLHIKARFAAKDALDIPWTSLSGFVSNISKVTEEFRVYRSITAMKVVFMGPPASGKSFYAALMAQEYEVQHILVGALIKEAAAVQNDLGASVRAALAANPRLSDALVADIIKTKLATPGCKNQGWILDGFPKNAQQARLLFNLNDAPAEAKPEAAEGGEGEAEAAPAEAADDAPAGPAKVVAPEIVVQIDAEEEFLLHRVMAYSQDKVLPNHDDEEGFKRRYEAFTQSVKQENSVVDLLLDSKARLVVCMAVQEQDQNLDIMRLGFGRPRNYDPERAARQREARAAEERARAEEAARLKAEADAEAERRQRAQRELEERERLQEIMQQVHARGRAVRLNFNLMLVLRLCRNAKRWKRARCPCGSTWSTTCCRC